MRAKKTKKFFFYCVLFFKSFLIILTKNGTIINWCRGRSISKFCSRDAQQILYTPPGESVYLVKTVLPLKTLTFYLRDVNIHIYKYHYIQIFIFSVSSFIEMFRFFLMRDCWCRENPGHDSFLFYLFTDI